MGAIHRSVQSGSRLLTRQEAVLVIIDMQEKLVPVMVEPEKIIENTKRLIALSKVTGLPIIITEQEKLGPTVTEIKNDIPGAEAIAKMSFNCFLTERFSHKVAETRRTTLIVCGIESHICVVQTALKAVENGFNVHVVGDAVSSRAPANKTVALDRMRMSGVTVTSTEMAIYEVLEKAGTDEFKAMLAVVK